jgi:hypothetical protein
MEAFKAQYRLSGRPEMLHAEDIERTIKAQEIVGIINDWMDVWGGGDAKTSASLSFGGVMDEEALTGSRYFIAKSDISDRFCLIRETKDVAGDPLWEHLYIEPGMFGDHIQFDGVWTQEVEGYSNPIAVSPTALFASLGITVQPKSYPDDTVLRYTVEPRESLYPGLEALYQEVESREHANSQRLMGITYEGETEIGKIHAPILFSSTPQSSHLAV